jgi:hypothetical protein
MYTTNRDAYRQAFFLAWDKHLKQSVLEPVEAQLVDVMLMHPEYHALLSKPKQYETQEFAPEENPFMHMSLHMAIREQIQTDRPNGIRKIYQTLLVKHGDEHTVLHEMIRCLADIIWAAQQSGAMPSEEIYLNKLKVIIE